MVDASVAIKWFLNFREDEEHCRQALEILACIGDGRVRMMQPPHFLAEMGAVLAREKSADALSDLSDLMAVEFEPAAEPRFTRPPANWPSAWGSISSIRSITPWRCTPQAQPL